MMLKDKTLTQKLRLFVYNTTTLRGYAPTPYTIKGLFDGHIILLSNRHIKRRLESAWFVVNDPSAGSPTERRISATNYQYTRGGGILSTSRNTTKIGKYITQKEILLQFRKYNRYASSISYY